MEAQVVEAINCVLSPQVSQSLKSQATAFCEEIKSSPSGYSVAIALLAQPAPAVRFFALQVFESCISQQPNFETRKAIQEAVLGYVKSAYVVRDDEAYVKNKLAQVWVLLMRNGALLEQWKAVSELLPESLKSEAQFIASLYSSVSDSDAQKARESPRSMLPEDVRDSLPLVDFFVRVCQAFDMEIASTQINRASDAAKINASVKQAMRDGAADASGDFGISGSVVFDITTKLYSILWAFQSHRALYASEYHVQIVGMAIESLGQLALWAPLEIVVHEALMPALLTHVGTWLEAREGVASLESKLFSTTLVTAVLGCVYNIVSKGMALDSKLKLFEVLGITYIFDIIMEKLGLREDGSQCIARVSNGETQTSSGTSDAADKLWELVLALSRLLSRVVGQLSDAWASAATEIYGAESKWLLTQGLELLFRLIPHGIQLLYLDRHLLSVDGLLAGRGAGNGLPFVIGREASDDEGALYFEDTLFLRELLLTFVQGSVSILKTHIQSECTQQDGEPRIRKCCASLTEAVVHRMRFPAFILRQGMQCEDKRIEYGADEYDNPELLSDEEERFYKYRQLIKPVFGNLGVLHDGAWQECVATVLQQGLEATENAGSVLNEIKTYGEVSDASINQCVLLEIALYVVFLYGESSPDRAFKNERLGLLTLLKSNQVPHPHHAISLQYLENAVRYIKILSHYPDALQQVLGAFLDDRGLWHQSRLVRLAAAYLLFKFVRAKVPRPLALEVIQALRPALRIVIPPVDHSGRVLEARSQTCLFAPSSATVAYSGYKGAFAAQLYLYETAGILIDAVTKKPSKGSLEEVTPAIAGAERANEAQALFTESVISPCLRDAKEALESFTNGRQTSAAVIAYIQRNLMAVGTVAKSFDCSVWGSTFQPIANFMVDVLQVLSEWPQIRRTLRFVLTRMLKAFDEQTVLSTFPVLLKDGMLREASSEELVEALRFFPLLFFQFKCALEPLVVELLPRLIEFTLGQFQVQPDGTDACLSLGELKRTYISFVISILNNQLSQTLLVTTPAAGQMFEPVSKSIADLATTDTDYQIRRQAIGCLSRLVVVFLSSSSSLDGGTKEQVYETLREPISRVLFQVPLCMNYKDAKAPLVINEIANLHITMTTEVSQYSDFLKTSYFPSILVPVLGEGPCTQLFGVIQSNGKKATLGRFLEGFYKEAAAFLESSSA